MNEDWRNFLIERINNLFINSKKNSLLYGLSHALAVENSVQEILTANNGLIDQNNIPILLGAALLHDIGHARRAKNWTLDWFAHIKVGKELARSILTEAPLFGKRPDFINKILHFIAHHDDTTYLFPISGNNGKPKIGREDSETNDIELLVLREADALVHTLDKAVDDAVDEWKVYSLPLNADNIALIPSWCWNKSIISNIRLLAKRFVLDSFTKEGKELSLATYDKLENQIQIICLENDIVYQAEICHPRDRQASMERVSSRYRKLQIVSILDLSKIVNLMRNISLLHNRNIHPYEHSRMRLQLVDLVNVTPMALYLMKGRLEETLEFHDALMAKYAFGLWDLPGFLKFRHNSAAVQKIAPPLIEVYKEKSKSFNLHVWGLVDGLHRFRVADHLGYKKAWAMMIYDVGYPLVPLPVAWDEIEEYQEMPKVDEKKRRYRYAEWSSVPIEIRKRFNINQKNFKYFFYRDLRPIGSKGKRDFDEFQS